MTRVTKKGGSTITREIPVGVVSVCPFECITNLNLLSIVVPLRIVPTENRTPLSSVPGFSGTQPRESNGKIAKKIKNEGLNVLPDSAQGRLEGSNPSPHSLGLGLGPIAYLCCW